MKRENHIRKLAIGLLLPAFLSGCNPFGSGDDRRKGAQGPKSTQPGGPAPRELRSTRKNALPPLARGDDVPAFIAAASAAPVSQREEIRAILGKQRENGEIANRLIAEFETARRSDFSRALVILSLIGEQGNPAATTFLARFIREPLPKGGVPNVELGLSAEAEALERLQVKAANSLPYPRTREALQATLEVVKSHPLKAVRAEAASSYLWNSGNSEKARRILAGYLRRDELMLLDRPVRDAQMNAQQFNALLSRYLERHPELRAPAPKLGAPRDQKPGTPADARTVPPPDGA